MPGIIRPPANVIFTIFRKKSLSLLQERYPKATIRQYHYALKAYNGREVTNYQRVKRLKVIFLAAIWLDGGLAGLFAPRPSNTVLYQIYDFYNLSLVLLCE